MDRFTEYKTLMADLTAPPPQLDGCVSRARARFRRARSGRRWGVSLGGFAGLAAVFVLLVNCSVPFAKACGSIPILQNLASAVALSPSLKAAVENGYVQPIGLSQTQSGITAAVEYLIVDQKQINVFFTVDSSSQEDLRISPEALSSSGDHFPNCFISSSRQESDLRLITIDFFEDDIPDSLLLNLKVSSPPDQSLLAQFSFALRFDSGLIQPAITYQPDRELMLDGQRITISAAELFPTYFQLTLQDDPQNTAWLKELEFHLTDGAGHRYDRSSVGPYALQAGTSPFVANHRLESPYFTHREDLTVHITGAFWMNKETFPVKIQRSGEEISVSPLPDGVLSGGLTRRGGDVILTLFVPDPKGESWTSPFGSCSTTALVYPDRPGIGELLEEYPGKAAAPEGYHTLVISLAGQDWSESTVELYFIHYTPLDVSVNLP